MEGPGSSRKVKEGLQDYSVSPSPSRFFWTLDFGFGTRIWDLDFVLGFWTGLGLDNSMQYQLEIPKIASYGEIRWCIEEHQNLDDAIWCNKKNYKCNSSLLL